MNPIVSTHWGTKPPPVKKRKLIKLSEEHEYEEYMAALAKRERG